MTDPARAHSHSEALGKAVCGQNRGIARRRVCDKEKRVGIPAELASQVKDLLFFPKRNWKPYTSLM